MPVYAMGDSLAGLNGGVKTDIGSKFKRNSDRPKWAVLSHLTRGRNSWQSGVNGGRNPRKSGGGQRAGEAGR